MIVVLNGNELLISIKANELFAGINLIVDIAKYPEDNLKTHHLKLKLSSLYRIKYSKLINQSGADKLLVFQV